MKHLDLFAGIGGFSVAVDEVWPDVEHVFCEIDPFCQAVLKKHWPNATIYGDIRDVGLARLQADGIFGLCKNDTARPSTCTNVACPSKRLPTSTRSPDRPCGKSSGDEGASFETSEHSESKTGSTEVLRQTDMLKMPSSTQSVKGLLNEKRLAKPAGTEGRSKTDAQKSKLTIPITTSRCPSCGFASDVITNGTRTTKRSSDYETNQNREAIQAGRIDLLTGGFP